MKKIVLFFVVSLMVLAESATVFEPEKPEAKVKSQALSYAVALKRVFSSLPLDQSYIPIYIKNTYAPVTSFFSGTVTAGDIDMRIWSETSRLEFNYTIPAGTAVDAVYNIPYPSTWLSNGKVKPGVRTIWMVVNPSQNGMQIDISEVTSPLDRPI